MDARPPVTFVALRDPSELQVAVKNLHGVALALDFTTTHDMTSRSLAFLDESGGETTRSFVLGGYVGRVEMWKHFSIDWQAVLDQDPPWPPFHAVACEGGRPGRRGERGFDALNYNARQHRMGKLIEVINKHKPQAILAIVDMDNFLARVPDRIKRRRMDDQSWKYPYDYAASHLFGTLCKLDDTVGKDLGTIDVVFDTMEQFDGPTGLKLQGQVINSIKQDNPDLARRLGVPIWPKADDRVNYVPLQAADLLVWHYRRYRDESDGKHRRACRELVRAGILFAAPRPGVDTLGDWIRGHLSTDERTQ
jgi:hypothetical protein